MLAVESEPLTEAHPLGAVGLGIAMLAAAYLWFHLVIPYERTIARVLSMKPKFLDSRTYRILHVYGGTAFLTAAGIATIMGGLANLG